MSTDDHFGEKIQFCEPYWYQGGKSPYYHEGHRKFRSIVRKFVEEEIKPNIDEWIKNGYPKNLHHKFYEAGIQGILYPPEYGGTQPKDYDAFYELILWDELARSGGGGVLGQSSINSMALPPLFLAGSEEMKSTIIPSVVKGKKNICLAISEPYAGSDVANVKATAKKTEDGKFYTVNGQKKWITGGLMGDYFTTAVRTGGEGFSGISLLLIEREREGVNIRKMETQFDNAHNTTFITMDDVKVPVENLIGKENEGFMLLMKNFNHERFVIAAGACRMARLCYEESIKYALQRQTFGKRLIEHQIIRFKLSEMVRQIEALYDNLERIAYQFSKGGIDDSRLGSYCALVKVNASKTFEYCAREASQIFGGASIVKEGKGKMIERLYREVRGTAIPGGSEEILLDFTIRQVVAKAKL